MRFTIKAKLAGAFGAVIVLSAITAGIGYMKLSEMATATGSLVSAAGRMDNGSRLKEDVLLQIRAEKNLLTALSDSDAAQYEAEISKFRANTAKMHDEIYAIASETGRKTLDKFAAVYSVLNATEDQTLKLVKTDKAKAIEHSATEGRKAVNDATEIADEYVSYVKKLMD